MSSPAIAKSNPNNLLTFLSILPTVLLEDSKCYLDLFDRTKLISVCRDVRFSFISETFKKDPSFENYHHLTLIFINTIGIKHFITKFLLNSILNVAFRQSQSLSNGGVLVPREVLTERIYRQVSLRFKFDLSLHMAETVMNMMSPRKMFKVVVYAHQALYCRRNNLPLALFPVQGNKTEINDVLKSEKIWANRWIRNEESMIFNPSALQTIRAQIGLSPSPQEIYVDENAETQRNPSPSPPPLEVQDGHKRRRINED